MLDISSPSSEDRLNIDFADIYSNSSLFQQNNLLIEDLDVASPGVKDLYFPTKYSQSFGVQFKACLWKQHWSYWRNPQHNAVRFWMTIVFGLIFGSLFWNRASTIKKQQDLLNIMGAMYASIFFLGGENSSSIQSVVFIERTVFYREKAAGMYSAIPYALAQISIEILYVAIQSSIYGLILFFMLGFSWQSDKLLWFMYFNFICFLTFSLCGMMFLALTPSPQLSAILTAFFSGLWSLFSGFIVPRPLAPIWVRWYFWASPVAWTLYGIVTSQFGDLDSLIEVPGKESVSINEFLEDTFGYKLELLKYVALANTGFVVTFFFTFTCAIKFLNFQKR